MTLTLSDQRQIKSALLSLAVILVLAVIAFWLAQPLPMHILGISTP